MKNCISFTNMRTSKIKVEGHIGSWYVIDKMLYNNQNLYLLESELYGGDAPSLIVDDTNYIIMNDVYNGFEDFVEEIEASKHTLFCELGKEVSIFSICCGSVDGIPCKVLDINNSLSIYAIVEKYHKIQRLYLCRNEEDEEYKLEPLSGTIITCGEWLDLDNEDLLKYCSAIKKSGLLSFVNLNKGYTKII